jgi:phage tail sheath gpL-like
MATSDAVGLERISRVVGYKLTKGNFSEVSPNLPQRIAIFAEANTANQASITANVGVEVTSAQQAGKLFGYGSPIHMIMRILRPISGGIVGGIPTIVYPQAEQGGAAAKVISITPTGTATGNGTHTVVIAGRRGLDGGSYNINIVTGDTPTTISQKIADAINNVLGCPMTCSNDSPVTAAWCTSKWKGVTAEALNITVDTNDTDLGVTYAVQSEQSASGSPTVTTALGNIGNEWATLAINSYGTNTDIMGEFEAWNGRPDATTPTGRYTGIIMKPLIALTGTVADDPSAITDARPDDCTIALCPAPQSAGMQFEAAANYCALFARQMQDNPHLDISGKKLPDMPVYDGVIGMDDYEVRDSYVKKGCSTVMITAGQYEIQDFVTTYHPEGEEPPQYRYCRNLMLDFNVRYGYYLLEIIYVKDKAIANDADIVNASNVIKPKQWKGIVSGYAEDLASRALIADKAFMQSSITVNISGTNPDRLETFFRYKRTGTVRIASTTAEAGFNFGNV